ncbi:MAG: 4-demethylwyosine synthase TYW1 [Methanobrevibacter sp.]|jgi:tRNA wybutosine-synthesizing protein 1|nr:4-demethylwyosine synthase TYW1 [Candidatus Methanovirga aequatorialis]
MVLTTEEQKKMEYSGYRFAGKHSHAGVKICHWTKKSILNQGECYKQKFYGIESHRCLQMSPAIPFCNQKCSFCWRDLSLTKTWWDSEYDDPKTIIDDCIKAQNNLLCGFFGNDKADKIKLSECGKPNNAAISLAGEPTFYPELNGLIEEFKRRNFTTFLVTNGLLPEKLKNLESEPTQIYISLDGDSKKTYNSLCNPQINDAWSKLMNSLEYLPSFNSRSVLRLTCVKGKNMGNVENYAKLIKIADPTYIEVKGYMCVGYSRKRLTLDNMPEHEEVFDFASKIADETGRTVSNQSKISRVVLLK